MAIILSEHTTTVSYSFGGSAGNNEMESRYEFAFDRFSYQPSTLGFFLRMIVRVNDRS